MLLSMSCSPVTVDPLPEPAPDAVPRHATVPWERLPGWVERFGTRHPEVRWQLTATRVTASSADGTRVRFDVPGGPLVGRSLRDLERHVQHPWQLGLLLVRRGGFAVARAVGPETVDVKVGKRHVQGRTKAGGWSQQRFARRRSNQAQAAFEAAAGYVESLLLPHADALDLLATGGDRRAVATVLATPALAPLASRPRRELAVSGDPSRDVLARALAEARSVRIEILDPPE